MIAKSITPSVDVRCNSCGYDLRAHDAGTVCPECGASVTESIKTAAVPNRPIWKNADPRWRQRILAGVWILTLMPLMNLLLTLNWASAIPVPSLIDSHNTHWTLDGTLLSWSGVYPLLTFCIGAVLLFSKERERRVHAIDWTRRWGVGLSYITLLLGAIFIFFITALVMTGIGALCISLQSLSMRTRTEPSCTQLIIDVSYLYLRYGPYPRAFTQLLEVSCSSFVVLLGCAPLFEALRSAANKVVAFVLTLPLALFALMLLQQVVFYGFGISTGDVGRYELYFFPDFVSSIFPNSQSSWGMASISSFTFFVECVKWFDLLAIAVWLTIAQVIAWWSKSTDAATSRVNLKSESP